jgi:hypothetical protein
MWEYNMSKKEQTTSTSPNHMHGFDKEYIPMSISILQLHMICHPRILIVCNEPHLYTTHLMHCHI